MGTMSSSAKQGRYKRNRNNNYKNAKKTNEKKQIEQKCVKLFGSKKKANKFIKQAILKGNSIRTKTKHLRSSHEGYQLLMQNNDIKTNKKLGIKSVISIEFEGNKTAIRISKDIENKKHNQLNVDSSNYPSLYPLEFQYHASDKILVLGEMDFSYSLDIAHKIGGKNIIATAYYNEQNAKEKTV